MTPVFLSLYTRAVAVVVLLLACLLIIIVLIIVFRAAERATATTQPSAPTTATATPRVVVVVASIASSETERDRERARELCERMVEYYFHLIYIINAFYFCTFYTAVMCCADEAVHMQYTYIYTIHVAAAAALASGRFVQCKYSYNIAQFYYYVYDVDS